LKLQIHRFFKIRYVRVTMIFIRI